MKQNFLNTFQTWRHFHGEQSTNKRVIKQVKMFFYPIDLKLSWVVEAGRVGLDSNH